MTNLVCDVAHKNDMIPREIVETNSHQTYSKPTQRQTDFKTLTILKDYLSFHW